MNTTSTIIGTVISVERGETFGQSPRPKLTIVVQTAKNARGYEDTVAAETLKPDQFEHVVPGALVAMQYRVKSKQGNKGWWSSIDVAEVQVLVHNTKQAVSKVDASYDDYAENGRMPF